MVAVTEDRKFSFAIRTQSMDCADANWIEQNAYIAKMRGLYGDETVDAFLNWFKKTFRPFTFFIAHEMRWNLGCETIEVNVDQMLITSFASWMAGRKSVNDSMTPVRPS